jgi:hypothetical protein
MMSRAFLAPFVTSNLVIIGLGASGALEIKSHGWWIVVLVMGLASAWGYAMEALLRRGHE